MITDKKWFLNWRKKAFFLIYVVFYNFYVFYVFSSLYGLVVISCIGGFLFGYDTGVISSAMIPIKRKFHLSYEYQEVVVSITLVGAIIGAITSAFFNERFGRRKVLLLAAISFIVGSVVMAVSLVVWLIVVGRFIVGLGIGMKLFNHAINSLKTNCHSCSNYLFNINGSRAQPKSLKLKAFKLEPR